MLKDTRVSRTEAVRVEDPMQQLSEQEAKRIQLYCTYP